MQAGDLVLILIGQHLVIALGHRLAQRLVLDPVHQLAIAFGQPLALIFHQMIGTECDLLLERFGQLDHLGFGHAARLFGVQHRPAPDVKGAQILFDRRPVQRNGLPDRIERQGQKAPLPRRAKDHHVGENRIPHRRLGQIGGIKQIHPVPQPRLKRQSQPVAGQRKFRVASEIARDDLVAIDHCPRAPARGQAKRLGPRAHHQIATNQRIAFARGHADRTDILGRVCQTAMDVDRPPLLGQPCHLHHAGPFAVDMRRLRHDGADGDNAGAANAGDDNVPGTFDRRQIRHRQIRQVQRRGCLLFHLRPFECDEGRTEPFDAGKVLVATGLINRPLAAQLGLGGNNGHAI
mmetsp:Transcript_29236/g.56592  ORF Transcript_29236/g.56592 Transcript_29236/m.56592 type:complete len:348 (+) Transcript_29236:2796-3839(+)